MSEIKNKKNDGSVNLVDLFFYLLSYWPWFLVSIVLCVGIAGFKYARKPFVYRADATVIIKNPANTKMAARLENYDQLLNRTTVSYEILQFRSKALMTETVRQLGADVNYKTKAKLRQTELYNDSPVRVSFSPSLENSYLNFKLTPKDSRKVKLEIGGKSSEAALRDTVVVNGGYMVITPNASYGKDWFGRTVNVYKADPRAAAEGFISRMRIDQLNNDASILTFTLFDDSVNRAKDVLNTLVRVYNQNAVYEKNETAITTAKFINDRLAIIGEELSNVEGRLQSFKVSRMVMSADEASNMYLEQTRASNEQIAKVETQIRLANFIKEYIAENSKTDDPIPVNTGIEDSRVENLIAQYNATKLERDRLLTVGGEESPVVKGMESSMANIRQGIVYAIDNQLTSLELQRNNAQEQESKAMAKFAQMPSTAREILSIERQQNIKEALYVFLLNKREENTLAQAMVDNNVRIIDSAEGSIVHISPSRQKYLLLGFLLGILIPLAVLLIMLIFDNKVHTRKEVEDSLSTPIVGEIPLIEASASDEGEDHSSKRFLYYEKNSKGLITEAMRVLCTNIDMMRSRLDGCQVITVSSFNVGSGKSFVVTNISACYADNKKKVVILDIDLRKRSISRYFGVGHKTMGLSNYLSDKGIGLEDILKHNIMPGVDIIPAGMVPPNPVELLRRERFDELISELRIRYDYVIIDSVPFDIVADPIVINRVVDTTLFVLRAGVFDRRLLPQVDRLYESGRLNNMGVIFNGSVVNKRFGYYYGYGYGYTYGYGYGYVENEEENN